MFERNENNSASAKQNEQEAQTNQQATDATNVSQQPVKKKVDKVTAKSLIEAEIVQVETYIANHTYLTAMGSREKAILQERKNQLLFLKKVNNLMK